MQQFTIKDVISRTVPHTSTDAYIYLVREGETVFYIGQSMNPYTRLESHMGMDWRNDPSVLGRFVKEHQPDAEAWVVEIYTLSDCEGVTQMQVARGSVQGAIDDAEDAMIKMYRPCLNTASNPNPAPLPEKYQPKASDTVDPLMQAVGDMLFGDM